MNEVPVLDYSLTVHARTIKSGLYDTVHESPPISADLGRGTANFPAGHLLPLNRPDYLHTPAYPVSQYQPSSQVLGEKLTKSELPCGRSDADHPIVPTTPLATPFKILERGLFDLLVIGPDVLVDFFIQRTPPSHICLFHC
jgi:hypothetical protein